MKKQLLTICLAMTMALSMTACKKADKEEVDEPKVEEKEVEKATTIKKTVVKNSDEEDDTPSYDDKEDNTDDEDRDDSASMKDDDETEESSTTSSYSDSAAYQAILDVAGYSGKPNAFKNKKTLKNTSFAKYIAGGIQIVEVGSNKDVIYEIIDSAIYPLPGYTQEAREYLNSQYQSIPLQYAQYPWIEVTCTLEEDCEVIRFRYKDLDDPLNAAGLQYFGHSPFTDLSTATNGYLAGGFTMK